MVGDEFALKTLIFPDVVANTGRLPAGGNVVMIPARTSRSATLRGKW